MLAADCGHKFCKDCWKQYLTFKIRDEGVAEAISCPESDCEIIVDDVAVLKLVEDKDVRDKYQHLMTDSFVEVRIGIFFFYQWLLLFKLK